MNGIEKINLAQEFQFSLIEEKEKRSLPWYGSHSFLNEYIQNNKCKRIMEIGVLNGKNARTMVGAAIQNTSPDEVEYYGFDFFRGTQFQQVYHKLELTGCKFTLFKGDTTETLPKAVQTMPTMDLIFIDGGKSYSEAKNDWEHSMTLMHDRTAVFVHNYDYSGVRRMVDNISREEYQVTILHPSYDADTAQITKKNAD